MEEQKNNMFHFEQIGLYDSVFGKRVIMYWENRGTLDYSPMNGFMVGTENYIFLERGKPHLSKNVLQHQFIVHCECCAG